MAPPISKNKSEAEKRNEKHKKEAFHKTQVLHKRTTYYQHGEGLKDMPAPGFRGKGRFSNGFNPRNAQDNWAKLFGIPFKDGRYSTRYGGGFRGFTRPHTPKKPPPVESQLPCTLEHLYSGSTKKMKITRTLVNANGWFVPESEILTIAIKPAGWKKGTKITFPDKGNQPRNQLPADLVFVIDEKPHNVYKRDGNNLIVNYKVSLAEAIIGGLTINLTTLDKRDLQVTVTDIVHPGYEHVVRQEGMPISKEPGTRGDLKIKFEVEFPPNFTQDQREALTSALGG